MVFAIYFCAWRNKRDTAYCGMDESCVFAENKRSAFGGRKRRLYVEGSSYADGIFLPAYGGGYSAEAENERFGCAVIGRDFRAVGVKHGNAGVLFCCNAPLQPDSDAGGGGLHRNQPYGLKDYIQ